MKKDAYYFSHDAGAQEDPKCVLLIEQLGMEGYGIFWALVERLRNEKQYKLPLLILPALSRRWNTSKEKVEAVVKSFGLFQIEDELFFSLRLIRSMVEYNERRIKYIEAGRLGGKASVKHRLSDPQALKESKGKGKVNEKKGNESKEYKNNRNPHLFENSVFFDISKFESELQTDEKYAPFDFQYYYEAIKNWSADGNTKKNWIATVKNWMLRDLKDGKPKLKTQYQKQFNTTSVYGKQQITNEGLFEQLEKRINATAQYSDTGR